MNWKPSQGLLKAESVVQTILADAAAVGIHVTNPALRWRIVQVIADELDRALADGQGMGALPVRDVSLDDLPDFPANGSADVQEHDDGAVTITLSPAGTPKKRRGGRGRPKGAKNKAKPAEANP